MGYIVVWKNCVFQTLRHYKNYTFEINASKMVIFQFKKLNFKIFTLGRFLSHFATSCDIVTGALQDEIKSFNISKLHFNMVIIFKHVKSFKESNKTEFKKNHVICKKSGCPSLT